MKKSILIVIILAAVSLTGLERGVFRERSASQIPQVNGSDDALLAAFENRQSNIQIQGSGEVAHILPDDNFKSRHQRFILNVASGQTLLIAHNIDLAKRIESIELGDHVEFYGEYEWNPKGGVIHWTHHDPKGSHVSGWIKHQGQIYQ
jgi:mRNA-degrading endonuclease HigB of HigAB toxin-antitoxin module